MGMVSAGIWDWEEAFLGQWCHFERGPDVYNPWILALFKNLDLERLSIMKEHAEQCFEVDYFERDGWRIPRRCPHQGVDLSKYSNIEDGVITCLGHGMSWDLATGKGINNNLCLGECTHADPGPSCECDIDD